MEVIAGEYPTKFLWKTIEKYQIRFVLYMLLGKRGDDELLHVQRRMHPEAPESSERQNDYASKRGRQQYQGNVLI